jgi:L-threonylcarbamoyladenylate synthase
MKYRHYAPSVPITMLRVMLDRDSTSISITQLLDDIKSRVNVRPLRIGLLLPSDSTLRSGLQGSSDDIEWVSFALGPSSDPTIIATRLFDGLLTLDAQAVHHILMEEIPEEREGLAIMNRARKAAGHSICISCA